MILDWYTKNALWLYWKRGYDEVVLSDEQLLDLEDENLIDVNEIVEIFRIETAVLTSKHNNASIQTRGSFEAKSIYEGSWGDATQGVVNFYAWLKRCFINHHKLDYELMIRLEEYWNVDEAIHDERELNDDHDIRNLDNDLVRDNAPYHTNEKEELYEEG
ncbi:hypothetical protein Tco_1323506, partial [Tanacetum coccineum]